MVLKNADEMINTGTVASIRKEEGNLSVKVCNAFLMNNEMMPIFGIRNDCKLVT